LLEYIHILIVTYQNTILFEIEYAITSTIIVKVTLRISQEERLNIQTRNVEKEQLNTHYS